MDCLLHQVLVAMLTATPVPEAPAQAHGATVQPRTAHASPAKGARQPVTLSKKAGTNTVVAQVAAPKTRSVN
jgi:hypothetical protein